MFLSGQPASLSIYLSIYLGERFVRNFIMHNCFLNILDQILSNDSSSDLFAMNTLTFILHILSGQLLMNEDVCCLYADLHEKIKLFFQYYIY